MISHVDHDTMAIAPSTRRDWESPLDQAEARDLTERIRSAAKLTCILLQEAHQRRAWAALGYRSWEQYVKREFDLSRRRSYELLDQARVILEVQTASGMTEYPHISAYAAAQIKPHLSLVVQTIQHRTAGLPEDGDIGEVVNDVIQRARTSGGRSVNATNVVERADESAATALARPRANEGDRVLAAIEVLAQTSQSAIALAETVAEPVQRLVAAERALAWLQELCTELREANAAAAF